LLTLLLPLEAQDTSYFAAPASMWSLSLTEIDIFALPSKGLPFLCFQAMYIDPFVFEHGAEFLWEIVTYDADHANGGTISMPDRTGGANDAE